MIIFHLSSNIKKYRRKRKAIQSKSSKSNVFKCNNKDMCFNCVKDKAIKRRLLKLIYMTILQFIRIVNYYIDVKEKNILNQNNTL